MLCLFLSHQALSGLQDGNFYSGLVSSGRRVFQVADCKMRSESQRPRDVQADRDEVRQETLRIVTFADDIVICSERTGSRWTKMEWR